MTVLDSLAAELGVSGRSLRRAVERGTIRAGRPSPRRMELSFAERHYVETHWKLLSNVVSWLRTRPNVRLAVVYGSVARGDDRPGSDFELLENYVIELAHRGLVAGGAIAAADSTTGREDLRSLAASGVITKTLRDRLVELHDLRNQLVHEYPDVKAHRLYAAATALLPLVRDFIARYLAWLADLGFETSRGRLPSARRRRRPRRAAGRSTRGPGRPLHATGR